MQNLSYGAIQLLSNFFYNSMHFLSTVLWNGVYVQVFQTSLIFECIITVTAAYYYSGK